MNKQDLLLALREAKEIFEDIDEFYFYCIHSEVFKEAIDIALCELDKPAMQPVRLIGGSLKSDGAIWYKAETVAKLITDAGYPVEE